MNYLKSFILLAVFGLFLMSCSKSDDTTTDSSNDNNNNNETSTNKYSGSASYGDLVTFEIDKDDQSYTLYNETTSRTETGNYSLLSGDLNGIYEVKANGETFYGIELDDKIVTANFPSGNSANEISFGVSSEIDNSERLNDIYGDYIYIRLGNYSVNGSNSYKEWGVFTLSDEDIYLIDFASGGDGDDYTMDITEMPNVFPVAEDNAFSMGSWNIDGDKKDRMEISIEGNDYVGYAYAAGNTAVFLMDLGTGMGSAIGFKVVNTSISQITGNYKYIDIWEDGTKGAGNYNIGSDGMISANWTDGSSEIEGEIGPMMPIDNLGNVYYIENYDDLGNDLFIVIAGEAIMHFIFDAEGQFISYGAGAKL